jgi:hypothetical protein
MDLNSTGIILIGSADAGPLRYLVFLKNILDYEIKWLASDVSEVVLKENGLEREKNWENLDNVKLVISGTCSGAGIDKSLILWAKNKNIKSISIIEHWSWYRKRFELEGRLIYPNYIFVNDHIAKTDAIKDGIDPNIIHIAGNILLEDLTSKDLDKNLIKDWKKNHRIPEKEIILFVSESLRDSFPKGAKDYIGYNEYEVIEDLIEIIPSEAILLIKLHPEEPSSKYDQYKSKKIHMIKESRVSDLAVISSRIIGMSSMLLLELATFRDDIVSYKPNNKKMFIGDTLGATINIKSKKALLSFIRKNKKNKKNNFRNKFIGSSDKITSLLIEILCKRL